jgi:type I restriction enzyme S subunit
MSNLPDGWKKHPLNELYDFRSGLSKPRSEFGFGYGFLSFKDVFYNFFIPDQLGELVNSTEKERKSCSIKKGDVFLTRTSETMDELGMSCVALKDYEGATFNGFTKRLRPKTNIQIIPEYAGYFFRSPKFRNEVTAMSSLCTRASLNNEMLGRLKIILPSIEEQITIGHILKSLDDKIELNQQMNQTLEAIARAIFKSWFVDFDPVRAKMEGKQPVGMDTATANLFPDSFEESDLGLIPRGWRVGTIGELVKIVGGSTPSTKNPDYWENGHIYWTTPKDLSSLQSPVLLNTDRKITELGLSKISSGLLPKGTLLLSSRAPIGYLAISEIPVAINQGYIAMICDKELSNYYVLHWARNNMDVIIGRANGTTFLEISKSNFRPIDIIIPDSKVLKVFNKQVNALHRKIVNNLQESRTLANIRDTLLPKLMSGEIRVKEAERMIEEVI